MTKQLVICETCSGPGTAMADALRRQLPEWDVKLHACVSACTEPVALAVQASGKATYVFAGLDQTDLADITAFLALYDAAAEGWIEDARPAGRLRFCLKSRVPAL